MKTLSDVLKQTDKQRIAVGHFNVSDFVLLKAVFGAAKELNVPVIVGASEGERSFMGVSQIASLVSREREEFDFPIFLNADHTHSRASAEEAARAGFYSAVFDLSALPLAENIRETREAVAALKAISPSILVEGEIGDIGSGSEIHETMPARRTGLTPTRTLSGGRRAASNGGRGATAAPKAAAAFQEHARIPGACPGGVGAL